MGKFTKLFKKLSKKKWGKLILIVLFLLSILARINYLVNKKVEFKEVSYIQFEKMIEKKQVQEVRINYDKEKFVFVDKKGNLYVTDNPRSQGFKLYLLENDIKVKEVENNRHILSYILQIVPTVFWMLMLGMLFKESFKIVPFKNEVPQKLATSTVKFSDIAANAEAKKDMINLVHFLKNPEKYVSAGADMPKGVIFYGPPGTGKTLMAKAIAGEAGVPFFSMSGSDFVEMYVGVGAKRVRELFQTARKHAPCVIFIDEIDAIGGQRGGRNSHTERDQTINALLSEMDGFNSAEGVLVIAATNRIEMLDDALIRPGRFDKHIAIGLPDLKGRLEILKLHAKNKKFAEDVDFEQLAKTTIGFAGADLKTLLNEATITAVNAGRDYITNEDIDKALYQMLLQGHEKEENDRKKEEIELVAWHEAGHAVVTKLITNRSVPKVTIIPSTSGAGGVTFITPEKMGLHSKKDIINDIKISYGGRVAEFLLLGSEDKVTTGASEDIKRATQLIRSMIETYGMTDSFGLLNLKEFENIDTKLIIEEAKKISKTIYQETLELLTANKHIVEAVANRLIEKETINEKELDEIIENMKNKNTLSN